MIPVQLFDSGGRHGISVDDFERRVLSVCSEHQAEQRAAAFALILHGPESPQFSRALSDPNYWLALHEISGNSLTVFAVFDGALRGASYSETMEHYKKFSRLKNVYKRLLEHEFSIDTLQMPALLFFQVNEGVVCGTCLVQLGVSTTEAAYQELSEILRLAAGEVRDSVGKLIPDIEQAFSRIDSALRKRAVISKLRSAVDRFTSIKEFLGFFSYP